MYYRLKRKLKNFVNKYIKKQNQTLEQKENYLLFGSITDDEKRKRKILLEDDQKLEFNLYSKLAETCANEDQKEKKERLLDYYIFKDLYGTPWIKPNPINILGRRNNLKSNFNYNTKILKEEYRNKSIDFFANIENMFNTNKKDDNQIYNNVLQMNDKEIKKILEENTIKKSKTVVKKLKGTDRLIEMLIYLLISHIINNLKN